jgi:hypothetical protein
VPEFVFAPAWCQDLAAAVVVVVWYQDLAAAVLVVVAAAVLVY